MAQITEENAQRSAERESATAAMAALDKAGAERSPGRLLLLNLWYQMSDEQQLHCEATESRRFKKHLQRKKKQRRMQAQWMQHISEETDVDLETEANERAATVEERKKAEAQVVNPILCYHLKYFCCDQY